jgi:hypothetical protein
MVFSVDDSISLSKENRIYAPEHFTSELYFIDRDSKNVLAVIKPDSTSSNLDITAENVARALFDLAPAYHSLTKEDKANFQTYIVNESVFDNLEAVVDHMLSARKSIYGNNPELTAAILKINDYITVTYFPDDIGGRKKDDKKLAGWINNTTSGGTLVNQVSSFAGAIFKASGEADAKITLDPAPLYFTAAEKKPVSDLKDNYYLLRITQKPDDIVSLNTLHFANGIFNTMITAVYGVAKIEKACQSAIVGSVVQKISSMAIVGGVNSLEKNVKDLAANALKVLGEAVRNPACQKSVLQSSSTLLLALTQKINAASNVIIAAKAIQSLGEAAPLLIAIVDPVDIADSIQVYNRKIVPGIIKFEKGNGLPESASPGQTLYPQVRAAVRSSFSGLSDFTFAVNWKAVNNYGSVSSSTTNVKADALSSVSWVIPSNAQGTFQAQAEIKDREGDHLRGSPVTFKTNSYDSTAIYAAASVGMWTVKGYDPKNPTTTYTLELFANGRGTYRVPNNPTAYNVSWYIQKNSDGYRLYESGFWHPAYNGLSRDKLKYPITRFRTFANFDPKFVSQEYIKN